MITLNVGSHSFKTTRNTLEMHAYFNALIKHSSQETYFIDRDGTHFRWILNWIRGSTAVPDSWEIYEELQFECDFYGVTIPKYKRNAKDKIAHALDCINIKMTNA